MSDQEKFHEEVERKENNSDNIESRLAARALSAQPLESEQHDTIKAHTGEVTQYAYNGPGYCFTSSNVNRIPSGIYDIAVINNQITLVKTDNQTDSLLRLPDTRSEEIIKEISNFWKLKREFKHGNEYAHGGFVHKRGYMFFGPPGSGKTSTAAIVAEDIIREDGIVINGDMSSDIVSNAIKNFRKIEPDRNVVVLLEDFDELIRRYSEVGYLSMLDGENSIDGSLFIATTNYPGRFEQRIYNRPGRFSDVIYIGMPSRDAREMYLKTKLKIHKDIPEILEFTEGFSIDHLRSIILGVYFEKKPLLTEIERLRKLFKPPKENPESKFGI